jgi:hypothetical protein
LSVLLEIDDAIRKRLDVEHVDVGYVVAHRRLSSLPTRGRGREREREREGDETHALKVAVGEPRLLPSSFPLLHRKRERERQREIGRERDGEGGKERER